ncbi:MAG: flavin reductase family protein, partial [Candidatus Acidiferrales bacterium]
GVTVITVARAAGAVHGMTANAFSSVSLEPPLVLVCVDHASDTHPLLRAARRFGVSVLREDQQAVARYFAEEEKSQQGAEQLGIRYRTTARGTPLLDAALAQLDCALVSAYEAGDHTIFIGEVEEAAVASAAPLLFYGGDYRRLNEEGP